MNQAGKSINFYTAYRESLRTKKPFSGAVLALIPIALIVVAICGVAVFIRLGNLQKQAQLDGIYRQIEQLDPEYQEVALLIEQSEQLAGLADELQADADAASWLPKLDRNLFEKIVACAGDTFKISNYRYTEQTLMLEIDASAPSVNNMPELVESLRATGLFLSIQYIGYTSDTDGVYYCTVGCVLAAEEGEYEYDEAVQP